MIATVVVLALTGAGASPPRSASLSVPTLEPGGDPWNVVMGLQTGRLVLVGPAPGSAAHTAHGEEFRAAVVAADRSSLELRGIGEPAAGQAAATVVLSRDEIQYLKVPASQDRQRRGGWLGAGIGFGAGAALGARGAGEEGSFWPITVALFGAALGLVGWLVGRSLDRRQTAGDFITIFVAEAT